MFLPAAEKSLKVSGHRSISFTRAAKGTHRERGRSLRGFVFALRRFSPYPAALPAPRGAYRCPACGGLFALCLFYRLPLGELEPYFSPSEKYPTATRNKKTASDATQSHMLKFVIQFHMLERIGVRAENLSPIFPRGEK